MSRTSWPRAAAALLAATAALAASVAGCRRGQPTDRGELQPAASASAARPLDGLEPGELAEGTERAFELVLPRGFAVQRRFSDSVAAIGPAPLDSVEKYLRRRLEVDRIEAGPARTVFERVRVRGAGPSARWLRIEASAGRAGSQIIVRDITPLPDVPGLDEAERWRRAGLGPGGKQLDPSEYQ